MPKIKQFRYGTDNLGYLIYDHQVALAIDGGATREILAFLATRGLELLWVANTHKHHDHTSGNAALLRETAARLLTGPELARGKNLPTIDGEDIQVFPTPGHSEDSVSFYFSGVVLTGDTLFNGTVGNCFTGDLRSFYESIRRLMALPPDTVVYAGHDYVRLAMDFLSRLDPAGDEAKGYLEKYDPRHVRSFLEDELLVNPYLRFDDSRIKSLLERRGLAAGDSRQRWLSLMSIE
ncbi:MAG: hydroxyacylglutathione hydrolase family protein [Smithellaceae bacterium]|nr:hydroxyacylglutathione hydrolase family protein [Smithellaceae bacterium]